MKDSRGSTIRHGACATVAMLSALTCVSAADDRDWEVELAKFSAADHSAVVLRDSGVGGRTPPSVLRQRWAAYARQFPDSPDAARLAAEKAQLHLANKDYDAATAVLASVVERWPAYTDVHGRLITQLARAATDKTQDGQVRLTLIRGLRPFLQDRSFTLHTLSNTIAALPLTPEQKYELAESLEASCGVYPYALDVLWRFLQPLTRGDAAVWKPACMRLIERYGTDCEAGRAALICLTGLAPSTDRGAAEQLALMAAEDRQWRQQCREAFAQAQELLMQSRGGEAAELLRRLHGEVPAWCTASAWRALINGEPFAALSADDRSVLLLTMAELAPPGQAIEEIPSRVLQTLPRHPLAARIVMTALRRHPADRARTLSHAEMVWRRLTAVDDDPRLAMEARRLAAELAGRLNATDEMVRFQMEAAKAGWDYDIDAATDLLRQAAACYPQVPAAAEAGWFLSLLDGTRSLQQPLTPRPYAPALAQPELPDMAPAQLPAPGAAVRQQADGWTLVPLDPGRNLLKGRGSADAAAAFDGDDQTACTLDADRLPVVLAAVLTEPATLNRVRVLTELPTYYMVTLLDSAGRPVARFERDWSFWEQYRSDALMPDADTTLHFPPVGAVAAVVLHVRGAPQGSAVVREMQAFAPPFAAAGLHEGPVVDLAADDSAVRVSFVLRAESQTITQQASAETVRGYPIMRWSSPWGATGKSVAFNAVGGGLGITCWGAAPRLTTTASGKVQWWLDDQCGEFTIPPGERNQQVITALGEDVTVGRHHLQVRAGDLPGLADQGGGGGLRFESLSWDAAPIAEVLVRFAGADQHWGPWLGPVTAGQAIAVPGLADRRAVKAQWGLWMDSRPVLGGNSAVVRDVTLTNLAEPGTIATAWSGPTTSPAITESLQAVAESLQRRELVIAYPKTGSPELYAAAQRLARKAGVYLVSDDIGLNLYRGKVLAIGTPLDHRYNRQLVAAAGLWTDPAYLNDSDGVVGLWRDGPHGQSWWFVTGETTPAVLAAAQRLENAIQPHQPDARPFRLAASDPLHVVYPWEIDPAQPAPRELLCRIGQRDRRSAVFAVVAERPLPELTVRCGPLTSESGRTLPPALVRYSGGYEWVPFFGDLRLPNVLYDQPLLPVAAPAALGVWITVTSGADTPAGTYSGEVSVSAAGHAERIPIRVRVDPLPLPATTRVRTTSFAHLPPWFHRGSPLHQRALAALADDEASQLVNVVGPDTTVDVAAAEFMAPVEIAVAPNVASPSAVQWVACRGQPLEVGADQALFLKLAEPAPLAAFDVGLAVTSPKVDPKAPRLDGKLKSPAKTPDLGGDDLVPQELQLVPAAAPRPTQFRLDRMDDDGKWVALGTDIDAPTPGGETVVRFTPLSGAGRVLRLSVAKGTMAATFRVTGVAMFPAGSDVRPFRTDCARIIADMAVFDRQYQRAGQPLPQFYGQLKFTGLSTAAEKLYGQRQVEAPFLKTALAQATHDALRHAGLADRFYAKVADEPSDIGWWTDLARPYRQGGLRTMTCHSGNYPDIEKAIGVMDPWCPNYQHNVLRPFFRARQAGGEQVWWYCCGVPVTRITGSPVENLPFYWLTAKWRFDGAMNYAALHCSDYSMPVPFRYEHGMDHRMVMFPDGSLAATTRRELEGDGIRDLRLIEFIRASAAGTDIEAKLDALIASIVPYKYGYATDPAQWLTARDQLYDLACAAATAVAGGNGRP